MDIGKLNHLKILKEVSFGLYLDGGADGEILLPKRYIPEGSVVGDTLEVFIYRDSEDRLIATTEVPAVSVGQCAFLKAQAVNRVGAFLGWGLHKDLLAPFNQQAERMEEGKSYVVYAYVDDRTRRIAASSKLNHFLNEDGKGFMVGQEVQLLIAARSDLGYKAVINGSHLGLIFHREVTRPITIGQKIKGYIRQVRAEDGRIDLALDKGRALTRGDLQEKVIAHLKSKDGVSNITDRSDPTLIQDVFGASKGNYKKALGALYKNRKILIEKGQIRLVEEKQTKTKPRNTQPKAKQKKDENLKSKAPVRKTKRKKKD